MVNRSSTYNVDLFVNNPRLSSEFPFEADAKDVTAVGLHKVVSDPHLLRVRYFSPAAVSEAEFSLEAGFKVIVQYFLEGSL